jgi:hypothetical protein
MTNHTSRRRNGMRYYFNVKIMLTLTDFGIDNKINTRGLKEKAKRISNKVWKYHHFLVKIKFFHRIVGTCTYSQPKAMKHNKVSRLIQKGKALSANTANSAFLSYVTENSVSSNRRTTNNPRRCRCRLECLRSCRRRRRSRACPPCRLFRSRRRLRRRSHHRRRNTPCRSRSRGRRLPPR